ncbi:hypothetical protein EGI22_02195 [Lacihabitans sp. LS3-19]|uniref:hypothetical protein n=1 Tax=Lacihabitans sp. LS3-19 TaxID=2487335 RepID=UPI0020CD2008|nr:hypothetical protein [Lacihabitans sp. LS3-19]MCP9766702.1 hypothetical protein [Lacihabitans sp. LS3-19]
MKNRRLVMLAVLLLLSITTFTRIEGNDGIRTIQFLSIFAIGAITSLIIREVAEKIKAGK